MELQLSSPAERRPLQPPTFFGTSCCHVRTSEFLLRDATVRIAQWHRSDASLLNLQLSPDIFRTLTHPSQQKSPNCLQNLRIRLIGCKRLVDINDFWIGYYGRSKC